MQLPSYNYAKGKLSEYGLMSSDGMWTFIVSSAFSGLCVVRPEYPSCYATNLTLQSFRSIVHCHAARRYGKTNVMRSFGTLRTPFKTLTRMYNQPTKRLPDGRTVGLLYKNPIDCLWKTLRAEGVFGWYKGSCDLLHLYYQLLKTSPME